MPPQFIQREELIQVERPGPIESARPGWTWLASPPPRYQLLGYSHRATATRLAAFLEGEATPMDLNDMALLLQDIIEEGMATHLDLAVYKAAAHFAGMGLCTVNGRMAQ